MTSDQALTILNRISSPTTKLGDLRKIAKEIKQDHGLAMELWKSAQVYPRLLAILIFDKKALDEASIDSLFKSLSTHNIDQRTQLADWLMANQLTKDKKLIALIQLWQNHPDPLRRRIFWYYQARLRWTGQTPPNNTTELLEAIERDITAESPEVQWAMNFTAGWIGVFEKPHRNRCVVIGENSGLFKDERVAKNCTPNYLPEFIAIEAQKRKL